MELTRQSDVATPRARRSPPLIGVAVILVVVTALFVGYRLLPENRTVEREFFAVGDADLGSGLCAAVRIDGRLRAQATRELGPLTRWSDIRLVDSTVRVNLRESMDDGSCPARGRAADAESFRIVQRWGGADPRFALFDAGNAFAQTIDAGPVEFAGDRRGSETCVSGLIELDLELGRAPGTFGVHTCLP